MYGSEECGVVEYMAGTNSAAVCTDKAQLVRCIRRLLEDMEQQKRYYENAVKISEKNNTLERSTSVFRVVVEKAIAQYGNRV